MIVLCSFCKNKCRKYNDKYHYYSWQCDYHGSVRVREVLNAEGSIINTVIVVFYKDETYNMSFVKNETYIGPTGNDIFVIYKLSQKYGKFETIIKLDFHPDITPENAEAKLAKYLIFS